MGFWNQEKITALLSLNEQGLSASMMAHAIGGGISRNAVIGKLNRLGIGMKHKGEHRPRVRTTVRQPPNIRVVKPIEPPPPLSPFLCEPATFAEGASCRFIKGDTAGREWQMCGQPGHPWCDYHKSVVFEPKRTDDARKKGKKAEEAYDRRHGIAA